MHRRKVEYDVNRILRNSFTLNTTQRYLLLNRILVSLIVSDEALVRIIFDVAAQLGTRHKVVIANRATITIEFHYHSDINQCIILTTSHCTWFNPKGVDVVDELVVRDFNHLSNQIWLFTNL